MNPIAAALLSAALFGASTPLAKVLLGDVPPLLLAGLLYLGSGLGLAAWIAVRPGKPAFIARADWPWLAGAVLAGGIIAPALLMYGLARTEAGAASLLLNLEAVLTAALAWLVFRENVDRRVFLGMAAIVAGGVLLSWAQAPGGAGLLGPLLIAGACLAWAIDNNLTRQASGGDAATLACVKGLVAGAVNVGLAFTAGASLPAPAVALAAATLGVAGYGASLGLFILALRHLGTARTGAYFSIAPFFGAALSIALLGEQPTGAFWGAAALMAAGVWLHITERHAHEHMHEPIEHTHEHVHDAHHRHAHDRASPAGEPHIHAHRHERMVHRHPHFPDLHHRHPH